MLLDTFLVECGGKDRAETVQPKPDRSMTHFDASLVQKVFGIPKRQRESLSCWLK